MGFDHVIPELIKKIYSASKNLKKLHNIYSRKRKRNQSLLLYRDAIDQIKVIEKNQKIMRFIMSDNQMNYQLEN